MWIFGPLVAPRTSAWTSTLASVSASVVTVSPSTTSTAGSDRLSPGAVVDLVDLDDVADSDLLLLAATAHDRVHRRLTLFGRSASRRKYAEGVAPVGASRLKDGHAEARRGSSLRTDPVPVKMALLQRSERRGPSTGSGRARGGAGGPGGTSTSTSTRRDGAGELVGLALQRPAARALCGRHQRRLGLPSRLGLRGLWPRLWARPARRPWPRGQPGRPASCSTACGCSSARSWPACRRQRRRPCCRPARRAPSRRSLRPRRSSPRSRVPPSPSSSPPPRRPRRRPDDRREPPRDPFELCWWSSCFFGSTGSPSMITPRPWQCLAGVAERLEQAGADPLAGHLDQAERGDLGDLVTGAVAAEALDQAAQHQVAVVLEHHVDEVDDDDAADVAQPELPDDLLGGLEVVLGDGLLEVAAGAGELAGVDVDDRHRLGAVDHQRAARRAARPCAPAPWRSARRSGSLAKTSLSPSYRSSRSARSGATCWT